MTYWIIMVVAWSLCGWSIYRSFKGTSASRRNIKASEKSIMDSYLKMAYLAGYRDADERRECIPERAVFDVRLKDPEVRAKS